MGLVQTIDHACLDEFRIEGGQALQEPGQTGRLGDRIRVGHAVGQAGAHGGRGGFVVRPCDSKGQIRMEGPGKPPPALFTWDGQEAPAKCRSASVVGVALDPCRQFRALPRRESDTCRLLIEKDARDQRRPGGTKPPCDGDGAVDRDRQGRRLDSGFPCRRFKPDPEQIPAGIVAARQLPTVLGGVRIGGPGLKIEAEVERHAQAVEAAAQIGCRRGNTEADHRYTLDEVGAWVKRLAPG